mmetsp:Transcript_56864/g.116406  ORF Transcript_56864/g.116406 Transcript_56864/m.116406 type:complete len:257 (-) Transcript_56864:456-1226(-)
MTSLTGLTSPPPRYALNDCAAAAGTTSMRRFSSVISRSCDFHEPGLPEASNSALNVSCCFCQPSTHLAVPLPSCRRKPGSETSTFASRGLTNETRLTLTCWPWKAARSPLKSSSSTVSPSAKPSELATSEAKDTTTISSPSSTPETLSIGCFGMTSTFETAYVSVGSPLLSVILWPVPKSEKMDDVTPLVIASRKAQLLARAVALMRKSSALGRSRVTITAVKGLPVPATSAWVRYSSVSSPLYDSTLQKGFSDLS